ncbi:MAG: ABC transporter permease [Zetaproteobacteria bacterium]|nr:MAG: ABC transporter permease [Zetaproteobacteria bacterium]
MVIALAAAWQGRDPLRVDLTQVYAGVSAEHWLGCDGLGRDVLARLAEGLRLSLLVGANVVLLGFAVGTAVGICAGWFGGWLDALLMRLVDVVLAFPGILLAIALAAMLGPGIGNLILALAAVGWVGFARLARGQVLVLRHAPFVQAAMAAGVSPLAVAWRHLLPNIAAPLLVEASLGLAGVVIGEAGLSFLGVGVQPPEASLGSMIREGTRVMLVHPWLVVWPGVALFCLTLAANLMGDALRDYLDVRTVPRRE